MKNQTTTTKPTGGTRPALTFTCRGDVRGGCGIRHRTLAAARACCDRDAAGVRSAYPSTYPTRAYSDREPVGLTDDARAEIEFAYAE